ncbi:uncharacterized protein [Antedon mediterranea]|uniref:uncharacterized protein n=1 Tax=Antedon mediterranea TaxID=105859 RepID=UPI003AF8313E
MIVTTLIVIEAIVSCLGNDEYITVLNINPQSNSDNPYQCYTPNSFTNFSLSYGRSFATLLTESLTETSWDLMDDHRYVTPEVGMGVYYCKMVKDGVTTIIQTTKIRNDAIVTPANYKNTVTTNIGDAVTIGFDTEFSSLYWRKDGVLITGMLTSENSMTVNAVTTLNAGVYEMYVAGDRSNRRHSFVKLIVRACPRHKWGPPDCTGDCEYCYNGGVCDDKTGFCICAPGFKGSSCAIECGGNKHSWNCERVCASSRDESKCRNFQFCLPDPYGCSCVTGYKGLKCDTECSSGTFGADCAQTCHCKQGGCDRYTGICTNSSCAFPWMGSNCQMCQPNLFGENCETECKQPCECHRINGKCIQGTCFSNFLKPNCVPIYGGNLKANISSSSVDIQWTTGNINGQVVGYFLNHKLSNTNDWKKEFYNTSLSGTITDLMTDTEYTFGVSAVRAGKEGEGPIGGIITVTTLCGKPSPVENVKFEVSVNVDTSSITVTWIGNPDAETLKCSITTFVYRVYLRKIINKGCQEEVYQTQTNELTIENVELEYPYAILVTVANKDSESESTLGKEKTETVEKEEGNANSIGAIGGAVAAGLFFGIVITITVTIL